MLDMFRNKQYSWILVPIEVKVRELESRLLLSCYAAIDGYGVLVGSKNTLNQLLPSLPKGLYFDKSISTNKISQIAERVNQGYVYGALDEEGLSCYRDPFAYTKQRMSEETLELTSLFCAWGKAEAEAITRAYPEHQDKVVITGNPRIDLSRPEFRGIYDEAQGQLREKYGKFILIPSNFSGYINASGPNFIIEQARAFNKIKSPEDEEKLYQFLDHKKVNLDRYLEAINRLSETFKDHTIIVRPHPSDSHKFWQDRLSSLANVKVVYEGKITPWLLAADAVIHHGCTTGLEAFLLDVPCFAYLPCQNSIFDNHLSNSVSVRINSEEELIQAISEILGKEETRSIQKSSRYIDPYTKNRQQAKEYLQRYIAALEEALAAKNIVNALQSIRPILGEYPSLNWALFQLKFKLLSKAKVFYERSKKLVFNMTHRSHSLVETNAVSMKGEHRRQKNPGITLIEVRDLINLFAELEADFKEIKLEKVVPNLFFLYRD